MMLKTLLRQRLRGFLHYYSSNMKGGKKPGGKGKLILFAVLMGYCGIAFLMMFFGLFMMVGEAYRGTDYEWLYFTMYAIFAFALMFIGSVFTAKAQLFEAQDNELLLAMPIPPKYILASRMLILLLFNLIFELVVAIPALVAWLMTGPMSAVEVIFFLLLTLALNLFAMAVTSLAAWGISLLTGRLGGSKFVKNLLTMVLFLAFFGAYMVVVSRANVYITALATSGEKLAGSLGAVAPLVWLGSAIATGNGLHFLLSFVILTGAFVLCYWLLSCSFITIVTTQRSAAKIKYEEKSLKVSKPRAALLRREIKRLTGSTGYMMNAGLSSVFCVVGAVALPFLKGKITPVLEAVGLEGGALAGIAALIICGICGMFTFSASSVSLEGNSLWIVRSMPVTTAQILEAKRLLHQRIAVLSAALPALSAAIFLPVDAIYLVLPCITYASLTASIGLAENLRHPKLDWINEIQPVKQGMAVLFSMLLNWAAVLVPVGAALLLGGKVEMRYLLIAAAVLFWFTDYLLRRWIFTRGVERFEAL